MPSSVSVRSALVASTLALAACATDASSTTAIGASVTELTVRPSDFLFGVPCSATAGSMQSYVVTLFEFDGEADSEGTALPSSLATPCSLAFGQREVVIAGKRYLAEVDGYELPSSALMPAGGPSSGDRAMVNGGGEVVVPRWTTRCGSSALDATLALANESIPVTGCVPPVDAMPTASKLVLDPRRIFGENACAIAKLFSVKTLAGTVTLPDSLGCDDEPVVLDAVAGDLVRLHARANLLDRSSLGTECSASIGSGQTVSPVCDALASTGGVLVDPMTFSLAASCVPGVAFEVRVDGDAISGVRLPCGVAAQVGPLDPGIVDLEVRLFDADGVALPSVGTCKAEVEPGRVVWAACL